MAHQGDAVGMHDTVRSAGGELPTHPLMELIALRHQVAVNKESVSRPKPQPADRLLWVWLSRLWPGWQQALELGFR